MKITVLGRGNAGCLTALHYHYYGKLKNKNIEVEMIYDSKIPTLNVGQATVLGLPNFLWTALGTDYYTNSKDLNYTIKTGQLYEGWGKMNDKIFHPFALGSYALHYDTQTFQNHILKHAEFNVKIMDEHIINYDKIDSDYIFDCRGWPKDENEYDEMINPLNAVLTSVLKRKDKEPDWTRAIATQDGWSFYIPLHNRVSVGYLYNSNITEKETAIKNFKNLYDIEEIKESFPFKQYIAKQPIKDNRIIFNGNRLFFLEPLEATSVETYLKWNRITYDCIVNKFYDIDKACNMIKDYTKKIQNFILWHYSYGSKYDTPFWNYAKKLSLKINDDVDLNNVIEYSKNIKLDMLRSHSSEYSQWHPWSFKVWYEGMTKNMKTTIK
jgi:tryptophan halogenase